MTYRMKTTTAANPVLNNEALTECARFPSSIYSITIEHKKNVIGKSTDRISFTCNPPPACRKAQSVVAARSMVNVKEPMITIPIRLTSGSMVELPSVWTRVHKGVGGG